MDKKCKNCEHADTYKGESVCWLQSTVDYIAYIDHMEPCEDFKERSDDAEIH